MLGSTRSRLWTTALLAVTLAACDDTTGPGALDDFDAQAALADYQAMDGVLASSGWSAFEGLGDRGPFAALRGAPTAVAAAGTLARGGDPSAFAVEVVRAVAAMDGPARAGIISGFNRGTTFVYDPVKGEYVADRSRTDAPPTGVRFILYDESSGTPDPTREIGYADLIDEGDGSAEDVVLRLVCVQHGLEVLNYRTTVDRIGEASGAVTVDGYLQNETDRLRFDIEVRGTGGDEGTVDIDFSMGIDSRDFEITGALTGTGGDGGPGEIDLTVRHGDDSIRVDLSSTGSELAGSFFLDGEVFATASGDPEDPTFTSADGDPLTTIELGVLIQIVGVVEEVFELFHGLVEPVEGLVTLGYIL